MLYIFAGHPQCKLNAGGIGHCVEEVENLGDLEHDPMIHYSRSGVYAKPKDTLGLGERLGDVKYRLSDRLVRDGITWDWFPHYWAFGNGATTHKTTANIETHIVDHSSGLSISDLLDTRQLLDFSKMTIQLQHKRTESWQKYESRWTPGFCPQENHQVLLTWFIVKGELEPWVYDRIERIIEDPSATLHDRERYQDRHFSPTRKWLGQSSVVPSLFSATGFSQ